MAVFASAARYFVVIAPTTTHESQRECNFSSYNKQGWCRLEQWARLSSGTQIIHVFDDDAKMRTISASDSLFHCTQVYQGEFHNHRKHGAGTEYYTNKSVFEGTWLDDKRHGAGTLTFASGETLTATWNNDAINPEAQGGAVFKDVNAQYTYQGNWSDEQPTEAASSAIRPSGSGLSVPEPAEENGEGQDAKGDAANAASRWVAQLNTGEPITDWVFAVDTTKQLDKKTRTDRKSVV
jgi:hypothetical protein